MKPQAKILVLVVIVCAFALQGCLFRHTVEPITFNREPTKVRESEREAVGRITHLAYPLAFGLSIRLGKNGLGDIAKEHGMNTIYYADIEKWRALFGLWSMDIVHLYGR